MNYLTLAKMRINRIYRDQNDNSYSYRFFQDLCTGFSYIPGKDNKYKDFISFEPKGCIAEKLFLSNHHHNISYEIERLVENISDRMIRYGKAYIYLRPEYPNRKGKGIFEIEGMTGLDLVELMGYTNRKKGNMIIFYKKLYGDDVIKIEIESNRLIVLSLQDIGYKKNYFSGLIKRLGKYDIYSQAAQFITESIEGYNFIEHSKRNNLRLLKVTKDIGWRFDSDGLSDSSILYRKIKLDKLKLIFLNYIISRINDALKVFLKDKDIGTLVVHHRCLNYDQLWEDFTIGKITVTELTNTLYPSIK